MKKLEETRNDNARLLNKMRKFQRNVIPVKKCMKNGKKHFDKQCELAWNCSKEGLEYVIEAEFENGKVADIFVLDLIGGLVYEVLSSEKEEDCIKKVEDYPVKRVIMVKV